MSRRERSTILGDILEAIAEASSERDDRPTRIAMRVNLPYDRFSNYLENLQHKGLVSTEERPRLTPKGEQLLRQFRAWKEALRLFGLHPPREGSGFGADAIG